VWAFDVDGCLVDSLSGASLRPHAREILTALHAGGATLVLWSAGGREHAEDVAARHGLAHLLAGVYDKLDPDDGGRRTVAHLPPEHHPAVVVDDRPEEAPAGTVVVGVAPYTAPDDRDRGLVALREKLAG